jgi:nucleoside-diphosphate-sugar epimerase
VYRQAGLADGVYRQVNAVAVGQLIDAAARAGVRRVVHCSTVGVHGDIEHPPAGEDAPLRPGDVYQVSKVEGESIARDTAARTGVELVIARPSGIYGPGDRRLLKLFRGVARRRFVVLGDGRIFYHLTYIDDLVEGFRLCGELPRAAGRTYILAGAEVPTLNDLSRSSRRKPASRRRRCTCRSGRSGWPARPAKRSARRSASSRRSTAAAWTSSPRAAPSTSPARAPNSATPCVSLRDGIRRTLAWYKQQGWL